MILAVVVWVLGLVIGVPCALYYLFVHAEREQYAGLIVGSLFWVFGYWGVVGPMLAAWKVRRFFKALENASSAERMDQLVHSGDAEDIAVDLIASENRIPKFLARRIYRTAMRRVNRRQPAEETDPTAAA